MGSYRIKWNLTKAANDLADDAVIREALQLVTERTVRELSALLIDLGKAQNHTSDLLAARLLGISSAQHEAELLRDPRTFW